MKIKKFLLFFLALAAAQFSCALDFDFKVDEETVIIVGTKIEIRETNTGIVAEDLGEAKVDIKFKFDEVPLEKRLELAKQNDPESIVMLAWRYYLGVSVEKDFDRALEYCKQLQALGGHDLNMLEDTLKSKILEREVLKNGKEKAIVAAQSGDANAAYVLARCYLEGKNGFEKNKDEAKLFFEIACGLGHKQACYFYAGIFYEEGDREKSLFYLKKAAEDKNFLWAQTELAMRLIENSEDVHEKEKLLEELKSIADRGFDLACLLVGNFYAEGKYLEKNEPLALEYFEKAARQGEDLSIMHLVKYYEAHSMRDKAIALARKSYSFDSKPAVEYVCSALLSDEVKRLQKEKESANAKLRERAEAGDLSAMADLAKTSTIYEALKLYKKIALANADESALRRIFEIWAEKFDPEEDLADFEKFYEMALGKKIFLACFVKGNLIEKGAIKSANTTPAELYKFGYENGSGECACALSRIWGKDAKAKEDYSKALECLKFAVSKGVPDALADYGLMLLCGGYGLEKNEDQGVEYLKRAVEAGNCSAAEILGEHYYKKNDKAECKKYLQKAVFLGSKKSARDLGYVHLNEKEYKEAARHFKSAMSLGDFSVVEDLAQMYKEGLGVEASEKIALALLFSGAQNGNADCLFRYAHMLVSSEDPKIKSRENGLKILRFLFPVHQKRMENIACVLVEELTRAKADPCEIYAYAKVAQKKGVNLKYIVSCVEYFESQVINDENRAEYAKRVEELEAEFADDTKTLKFSLPVVPAIVEYVEKNSQKDPAQNAEPAK